MGLIFLTPHEGRVVVYGFDDDPSWRPFPGRDLHLAETEEEFSAAYEAAFQGGTRRNPPFLPVNANSKFWQVSTRLQVLLVVKDRSGKQSIVGVGNAATETRRPRIGTASVKLMPWRVFAHPVAYDDLFARLSSPVRNVVAELFAEEDSREMPKATRREVWAAIRELAPDAGDLLESLPTFPARRRVQTDELTGVDAAVTSLRIFSNGWRKLEPVSDPPPPPAAALHLESLALRDEDEVITDDTGGFLDWESDGRASAGWYQFLSEDGRQLWVKNINFKPEETETGADLVYVRTDPELVVLVQYKLLTSNKNSEEFFFRDAGGRLKTQVANMLKYSTPPASDANGEDDYRIGGDIGFVKFVIPSRPVRTGDAQIIPGGRYHPAEGVLRMLNHPSKGKRKGDVYVVDEWRSLAGETFAKLVRDQWVGSVGSVTAELLETLNLGHGSLYLAVEQPTGT